MVYSSVDYVFFFLGRRCRSRKGVTVTTGSPTAVVMASILCYLISPGALYAQAQSSEPSRVSIRGEVLDSNGDGIGDATVTLKPLPDGRAVTVQTSLHGSFVLSGLTAGRYTLTASKPGFVDVSREVSLRENEDPRIILSLMAEGARESITVSGRDALESEYNGMTRMSEVQGMAIYAGKKNEVVVLANMNANLATGNTRQIFAKVPGANIWEIDSSGMQIGISNRGLDPNRSWEMSSRQNGYDITADIFGYPEAYFTPPLEAVERIEIVRGASSLQYGAQFGGLVNYILKKAPRDRRFTMSTEETGGSNSLFNSHNRVGGTVGKLTYNGYYQHRQGEGWRDNAGFRANTGFASLEYEATERLRLGLEVTKMAYLLHMAGGLTDELFEQNARQSVRPRNWFYLNWLVPAVKVEYDIDSSTSFSLKAFGLRGTRYSLFNSEPIAFPNGELNVDDPDEPRTLFKDRFRNHAAEFRLLKNYSLLANVSTFAAGFRYFNGKTVRQQGRGLPGLDADFEWLLPNVDRNLHFRNINLAGFVENIFHITRALSITPGLRLDYIHSTARGAPIVGERKRSRTIPLFGVGVSYRLGEQSSLYANITQAYRATLFNDYWRPDPFIIVDQNLKDMTGYAYEYGWRGRHSNWLYFDVGGFYLKYRDRLGLLTQQTSQSQTVSLWTNVADSRNVGLESFVEVDMLRMAGVDNSRTSVSIFSSVAQIGARYLNGGVRGHRVELAPTSITRSGLTCRLYGLSATLQFSSVSDQFSDADNTLFTVDGIQGLIPAYRTWDLSGSYQFLKRYVLRAGVNNLADARYFTRRAASYPGPGLIPAEGRSFYASVGFRY